MYNEIEHVNLYWSTKYALMYGVPSEIALQVPSLGMTALEQAELLSSEYAFTVYKTDFEIDNVIVKSKAARALTPYRLAKVQGDRTVILARHQQSRAPASRTKPLR